MSSTPTSSAQAFHSFVLSRFGDDTDAMVSISGRLRYEGGLGLDEDKVTCPSRILLHPIFDCLVIITLPCRPDLTVENWPRC